MSKEDVIEIEGIVREAMPNAIFKVEMLSTGAPAPKNRKHCILPCLRPFLCSLPLLFQEL